MNHNLVYTTLPHSGCILPHVDNWVRCLTRRAMWRRAWIKISNQETGKTLVLPMGHFGNAEAKWDTNPEDQRQNDCVSHEIHRQSVAISRHSISGWWLEHGFYDFPYIENSNPNWRTPSFFRGVGLNHQPAYSTTIHCSQHWGDENPQGSDTFSNPKRSQKKQKFDCLIVVSPRGSNETKETAHSKGFFLWKQWCFFGSR